MIAIEPVSHLLFRGINTIFDPLSMIFFIQKRCLKWVLDLLACHALPRDSAHDLRLGLKVQSHRASDPRLLHVYTMHLDTLRHQCSAQIQLFHVLSSNL